MSLLETVLTPLKFKYSKAEKGFSRTINGFKQKIHTGGPFVIVEFDEVKDELMLKFSISFTLSIPEYEKWHTTHFNNPAYLDHFISSVKVYAQVNGGRNLFKNRGPGIQYIHFFDNSDHFITQMEESVLIWNRQFQNIDFLPDRPVLLLYLALI